MVFNALSFITSLILTIILTPLNALILKLTAKWFKLENTNYGIAFKIMFILAILGLIMTTIISFVSSLSIVINVIFSIISIILALWLIKNNYNIEIEKAILVLIVAGIISVVISMILIIILTMLIGIIGLKILFGG